MATKDVTHTGAVELPMKAHIRAGMDLHPDLIRPIIWTCLACDLLITLVSVWEVFTVHDTPANALASACLLGNLVLLGVFFGKNGKAGALSMTE